MDTHSRNLRLCTPLGLVAISMEIGSILNDGRSSVLNTSKLQAQNRSQVRGQGSEIRVRGQRVKTRQQYLDIPQLIKPPAPYSAVVKGDCQFNVDPIE